MRGHWLLLDILIEALAIIEQQLGMIREIYKYNHESELDKNDPTSYFVSVTVSKCSQTFVATSPLTLL